MSAASCMFRAYDELLAAAKRFAEEGDEVRAEHAQSLAAKVAADDPDLLARMWRALPHGDDPGARPEDAFAGLNLGWRLQAECLELLRERRYARQVGGWWRALGEVAPR